MGARFDRPKQSGGSEMINANARFQTLARPRVYLLQALLTALLSAHLPAWAFEPETKRTAKDGRTIRDPRQNALAEGFFVQIQQREKGVTTPAPKQRVQHVFTPRSWAPRSYDDGASVHTDLSASGNMPSETEADEMVVLKRLIGRQEFSNPVAAAVTKDDPPPARPATKSLSSSHPNRRVRSLVGSEAGSDQEVRASIKPVQRRSSDSDPGIKRAPARRSPTRW